MELGVAPPDNAANAVQDAIASGNINAIKAVAPRVSGTYLEPALNQTVSGMEKAVAPMNKAISASNAKGGVGTGEGNLAFADQILAEYKAHQPRTGFWNGVSQYLQGNKDWSNAMTEGNDVPAIIPGKDGKAYTVLYKQNSSIPHAVFDENNKPIRYSDWLKLGGGVYKNVTDTPGYISGKISTEEFTKENNSEQSALNNAVGLFGNVISPRNQSNMAALVELKKSNAELPNAILNEIASKTSMTGSLGNTIASNYSNIQQANDVTSLNNALDKAREAGIDVGPKKIISIDAKGTIKTADGESYTKNDLLSKVKGGSSSETVEKGWTTAREQIVKGELYKRLTIDQKALVDSIMNNQQVIDTAKASYVNKHGWPSVLSPSAPYNPGQTLNSNIANSFIDEANLEHAVQAKSNLDAMLSKGMPIVPGSAASVYSQSSQAQSINSKYSSFMEQALRLPTKSTEEVAPNPSLPKKQSEPTSFAPQQENRLNSTKKLDVNRTNQSGQKVDNNKLMADVLKQFLANKEKEVKK